MKLLGFSMAILAVLVGCATTPTPQAESTLVPGDRALAFAGPATSTTGVLVVTRDRGFGGKGCFYAVSVNGVLAARLAVTESARLIVPAGPVLLRSGRDPQGKGLCALMKEEWTQRETHLAPGETKYFRLSIDTSGKTDIQRADELAP